MNWIDWMWIISNSISVCALLATWYFVRKRRALEKQMAMRIIAHGIEADPVELCSCLRAARDCKYDQPCQSNPKFLPGHHQFVR